MGRQRGGAPNVDRSLLCVIRCLEGAKVTVELRNDVLVRGVLEHVDDALK